MLSFPLAGLPKTCFTFLPQLLSREPPHSGCVFAPLNLSAGPDIYPFYISAFGHHLQLQQIILNFECRPSYLLFFYALCQLQN